MADDAWRARLKTAVPKEEIPPFLVELQALVAGLRRYRDNLVVPGADDVMPLLTERLRRHPDLVLAYLGDERYRAVVASALSR